MPTITLNPTDNETPDATLGGSAVTDVSDTGHGSTVVAPGVKSARWFTFQGTSGRVVSMTLKITHTSSGTLSGATAENSFTLSYSLNGGSSWTDAVARVNYTAAQGPTVFSVALSAAQDIAQVQVRDILVASEPDVGDTATATATVASIQLEVVTVSGGGVVVIM